METGKRTKFEVSNVKRIESLKQKAKQSKSERSFIQNALSQVDSSTIGAKKIIFQYDSDDEAIHQEKIAAHDDSIAKDYGKEIVKDDLFSNSSEDNEDNDIDMFRVRQEYEGKKGEKLIALQSKFGNDNRFKMDERFLESGSSEDENSSDENSNDVEGIENIDDAGEKQRNINILQSVIGKEVGQNKKRSTIFRDTTEIRYDPANPNASQFEVEPKEKRKKKPKKDLSTKSTFESEIPEVSSKTFYEVKENLKDLFGKKEATAASFSVLSMFGKPEENDTSNMECDEYSYDVIKKSKENGAPLNNTDNQMAFKKQPYKIERTFFFTPNDERLKSGQEFFTRKVSVTDLWKDWHAKRRKYLDLFNARKKLAKRKSKTTTAFSVRR